MKTSDIHTLVTKIPLFNGVSPGHSRELLADVEVRTFAEGETLCEEGNESQFLFVVLRGTLVIQRQGVDLAHVSAVDIIGEMGVISDSPRCATVKAEEEATVVIIPKNRFHYVIGLDSDLAATLYKNVSTSVFGKLIAMNDHPLEHLGPDSKVKLPTHV